MRGGLNHATKMRYPSDCFSTAVKQLFGPVCTVIGNRLIRKYKQGNRADFKQSG